MSTKNKADNEVTVNKEEYEALVHNAEVTNEFFQGKKESFKSAEELIENLKNK